MQYLDIFRGLNGHRVRYLVVGGIAVNLHGIQRATADLDLIVALDTANVEKFAAAMDELGYRPKVPVKAREFADPENRRRWREEKNMRVFSFYHPKDPFVLVDVFVYEPRPFADMDRRKERRSASGISIPIASLEDLIFLKEEAGRPKDMFDLDALKAARKMEKENR